MFIRYSTCYTDSKKHLQTTMNDDCARYKSSFPVGITAYWQVGGGQSSWFGSRSRRFEKKQKMFLPHPRVKFSIVGCHRDQEVACSASDRQGSNFESCVWRTVSSHHTQEILLAQFSLYVHKGGLKPDSFHFILLAGVSTYCCNRLCTYKFTSSSIKTVCIDLKINYLHLILKQLRFSAL